jgi:hypothetical protein
LNIIITPGEKIILSDQGTIEQPIEGSGELYLTNKRLLLIHKSGIIRKRETPLIDILLTQISYVKTEGFLRKALVIGVRERGGGIIAYKIHVNHPDSWMAKIYNLISSV